LKISMCVGRGRGLISALYRRDHFGEEDRAQIAVYRCVVVSGSERHLKTLNV